MRWLKELFDPEPMQGLDLTKLSLALNGPAVRAHWLKALLDQLRALNLEVDKLLEQNAPQYQFIAVSAKRRQLVAVLEQIETSHNSVALDQAHNQGGVLDSLAVQLAPGD